MILLKYRSFLLFHHLLIFYISSDYLFVASSPPATFFLVSALVSLIVNLPLSCPENHKGSLTFPYSGYWNLTSY